jgi:signal transduction histidine kinase
LKLKLAPVPLAKLLKDASGLYAHVAEEKQVRLRVRADKGLRVLADRGRLLQVVANLLDNALKFAPWGSQIDLSAGPDAGGVWIRVEDQGPGISAKELPHIWERLYRGDASRSQRGMGLGLSLVKAVVDAHGGGVMVESRPGQGARLLVKLPQGKLAKL